MERPAGKPEAHEQNELTGGGNYIIIEMANKRRTTMPTRKQKHLYDVLQQAVRAEGRFPSVREICRLAGVSSPATVHAYLRRLQAAGLLRRVGLSWELAADRLRVPLVAAVPAGSPLEVFAALGEEVDLPEWMVAPGGDVLGFRVSGQSMKDAYIQDGDVVVVRRTPQAEAGDMVVALLENGAITLKRLKKSGEAYFLAPENPEYSPIHEPFQLVGKVIGVLRTYR